MDTGERKSARRGGRMDMIWFPLGGGGYEEAVGKLVSQIKDLSR